MQGSDAAMVTTSFSERQYDLLVEEWKSTDSNIGRIDTIVLAVRGWSLAITAALIAFAYVNTNLGVLVVSFLAIASFCWIELIYKSFQRIFILRRREIEAYLASDRLRFDLETGSGLAIKVPDTAGKFSSSDGTYQQWKLVSKDSRKSVLVAYCFQLGFVLICAIGTALKL